MIQDRQTQILIADAIQVLRELVEQTPIDNEYGNCFYCSANQEFGDDPWIDVTEHEKDCTWLRARKLLVTLDS